MAEGRRIRIKKEVVSVAKAEISNERYADAIEAIGTDIRERMLNGTLSQADIDYLTRSGATIDGVPFAAMQGVSTGRYNILGGFTTTVLNREAEEETGYKFTLAYEYDVRDMVYLFSLTVRRGGIPITVLTERVLHEAVAHAFAQRRDTLDRVLRNLSSRLSEVLRDELTPIAANTAGISNFLRGGR
jgi:hypothetical protein